MAWCSEAHPASDCAWLVPRRLWYRRDCDCRCPWDARLPRRHLPGIRGARYRHLGAVGEAAEAGRDDAFAGAQAGADHGLAVVLLGEGHRPHTDGAVVLHHIHERPVRAALDGRGRHHDDLPQRVDQQLDVHELAGPKLQPGIGKLTLDLHRAGRRVDLIVDHHHLALHRARSCRRRRAHRPSTVPQPALC